MSDLQRIHNTHGASIVCQLCEPVNHETVIVLETPVRDDDGLQLGAWAVRHECGVPLTLFTAGKRYALACLNHEPAVLAHWLKAAQLELSAGGQWRYEGDTIWNDPITVDRLTGEPQI